jgi:hypothetical protein
MDKILNVMTRSTSKEHIFLVLVSINHIMTLNTFFLSSAISVRQSLRVLVSIYTCAFWVISIEIKGFRFFLLDYSYSYSSSHSPSPGMGGRKGRDGLFPATSCIKIAGYFGKMRRKAAFAFCYVTKRDAAN